ncbi:hypothetical protein KMZ68_16745 [Bradyrhizobium sediminis]|uniref:Cupin domain-containing protein n=1 Tax=Bradyrhizobium sediminis TaxID=2840469 RepID=A0A975NLH7_9BRAD|nr:hypothetical protein [Bradyrhizobium sediminis]QWG16644.1 hypothetical protein KMZ68_16745 [Bradyrhizobium sediminis]
MANPGDTYFNPVTRTKLVFTATSASSGGRELAMEWLVPPDERLAAAAHYHAGPEGFGIEHFDLLEGSAACRIGREEFSANAPHTFVIPTNTSHVHPWNIGATVMKVRQRITPPTPDMAILAGVERFFETLTALSQQGRANRKGDIRNPLQGALVLADGLLPVTYIAGIPLGVQVPLLNGLAGLARGLGYQAHIMPEKAPSN